MSQTHQTHSSNFEERQRFFEEQRPQAEFDVDSEHSNPHESKSDKGTSGHTYDGEYRRED